MDKKNIILIGAGGHCKSCIDVIESTGLYNIIGLVDKPELKGQKNLGYEILWNDDDIPELARIYKYFFVTVGHIKSSYLRSKLFDMLESNNVQIPNIISPSAQVSQYASVNKGSIVMHGAIVNADAKIGKNCIINSNSLIEHDVTIGDNCHISTGAIVNGGVKIGHSVFYGSGSISIEYINISDGILIGAGSFVNRNLDEIGIYVGNPIKKIKK